ALSQGWTAGESNSLTDATLCCIGLNATTDEASLSMHSLIKKCAIQILRKEIPAIMEANKALKEIPDEQKWTEDLAKVSLIGNDITEISPNHSPRCLNISTLTLCQNRELKYIAESFLFSSSPFLYLE
ncbi:hypothetical protein Tsubulata_013531, partial [Turnera subulata]